MTDSINNSQDIIDSRDIIERIKELEAEREDYEEARDKNIDRPWDEEQESDAEELKTLQELADECSGYAEDWKYGVQLIRDSYFEDYARELAEDIGAISRDATWPNDCIDWEQAAKELQMDYASVEFGDVTYWVR